MADKTYRILVINPGSTSTKVGVFDGETEVFTKNVAHEASKLAEFAGVSDQMPYRRDLILEALEENGVALDTIDAFVGRGGGLLSVVGGTYQVNDVLLDHAYRGANGIQHPAQLGSQLANAFAVAAGKPAFVVNPPDTDEFCDYARMTGIKGVYRNSHLHALNLKETAIRHAHGMGKRYDECNFIVCHIGGGISITAHKQGMMIDGYDIVQGEGAMAPTRCGAVPVAGILDYQNIGIVPRQRIQNVIQFDFAFNYGQTVQVYSIGFHFSRSLRKYFISVPGAMPVSNVLLSIISRMSLTSALSFR